MRLRFTKMHGLGNDFVVVDGVRQAPALTADHCRFLADRRFGVGCDQILLVEPPRTPDTLFHYRIFNADGSEVGQCGNGARCIARFVRDAGLTTRREIPVGTLTGNLVLYVEDDDQVRVDMGVPRFAPADIPFLAETETALYPLRVDGEIIDIGAVSMGNPHAVLQVDDVDAAPVATLGPKIEHHPRFPLRANVGFLQVIDRGQVRLRVFERGAGETLACGSGACAAVAVGRRLGLLDARVRVGLPGGALQITWEGPSDPLWMTGPAVRVYEGEIAL